MQKEFRYACCCGNYKKVYDLINKGVDINTKFRYGFTGLMIAIKNGHKKICELLISKGADINAKNNNGNTPLHLASYNDREETCELLISKGADINIKDNYGDTVLFSAIYKNNKRYSKLLIDNGAEVSDEDLKLMIDKKWKDLSLKVIRVRAWERRKHMIAMFKHVRKL